MTKDMNFDDLLREWASKVAGQYAGNGDVEVKEPSFPNGAVTVDIELERTLAQMLLWPSGMLEFRVFAIESGEEMAMEHHEIHGNDELAVVLGKVSETVAATEAAP